METAVEIQVNPVMEMSGMVAKVMKIFDQEKHLIGSQLSLLQHKLGTTIDRIKLDRYGLCDCGKKINKELLGKLEIFCDHCLELQAQQLVLLHGERKKVLDEIDAINGSAKQELLENNEHTQEVGDNPTGMDDNTSARYLVQKKKLEDLDENIRKVPFGQYGICEECEKSIPIGRLKVLPFALCCVPCQDEREKHEKMTRRNIGLR